MISLSRNCQLHQKLKCLILRARLEELWSIYAITRFRQWLYSKIIALDIFEEMNQALKVFTLKGKVPFSCFALSSHWNQLTIFLDSNRIEKWNCVQRRIASIDLRCRWSAGHPPVSVWRPGLWRMWLHDADQHFLLVAARDEELDWRVGTYRSTILCSIDRRSSVIISLRV